MSLVSTTLELLGAYKPSDTQEAEHHSRMLELVAMGPCAFSRSCYLPGHFTASAFVLSPESDRVLLILHAKLRLWLQPGGHIDEADVSLEAAARRELDEETALSSVRLLQAAPLDLDVHLIPARREMPAHEHFDVRFLYHTTDGAFSAGSDALDAKWIALSDLTTTATDDSVRRAVRKIATRRGV